MKRQRTATILALVLLHAFLAPIVVDLQSMEPMCEKHGANCACPAMCLAAQAADRTDGCHADAETASCRLEADCQDGPPLLNSYHPITLAEQGSTPFFELVLGAVCVDQSHYRGQPREPLERPPAAS